MGGDLSPGWPQFCISTRRPSRIWRFCSSQVESSFQFWLSVAVRPARRRDLTRDCCWPDRRGVDRLLILRSPSRIGDSVGSDPPLRRQPRWYDLRSEAGIAWRFAASHCALAATVPGHHSAFASVDKADGRRLVSSRLRSTSAHDRFADSAGRKPSSSPIPCATRELLPLPSNSRLYWTARFAYSDRTDPRD